MPNWVEQEAKRNNRNLLMISVVILVIGALLLFLIYDEATRRFAHDEAKKQGDLNAMYVVGALLLWPLWNLLRSLRRMGAIHSTPVWNQLAQYGDVEQIAAYIAQEEQMDSSKYKLLTVTRSWIIFRGPFKTRVWPMGDLLWAYQQTTRVYTYAIIRIGKYHSVVLSNRRGQKMEVRMTKAQAEALIPQLAERVPWAFFGYSIELWNALRKDLAGFVAALDTRRQQYLAKSKAATS